MGGLHGTKHKRGDMDRECEYKNFVRSSIRLIVPKSTGLREPAWKTSWAKSLRYAKTSMAVATFKRNWKRVSLSTETSFSTRPLVFSRS